VRRVGSFVLVGLAAFVATVVGYFFVTLVQVWRTGLDDGARPADAVVVLGAAQYDGRPSPMLAARLDRALELWNDGIAEVLVVTGGRMPGDRFTEAEASVRYLVERGVPAEVILREDEGASTWESIAAVAALLSDDGRSTVVLVSDPFHLLRVRLSASEAGLDATTTPTLDGPVRGWESLHRHAKEAIGVMLGRIVGFERLWRLTG
jgi:uncharacterized SAM-binding protein YcdF (DUF218 family)